MFDVLNLNIVFNIRCSLPRLFIKPVSILAQGRLSHLFRVFPTLNYVEGLTPSPGTLERTRDAIWIPHVNEWCRMIDFVKGEDWSRSLRKGYRQLTFSHPFACTFLHSSKNWLLQLARIKLNGSPCAADLKLKTKCHVYECEPGSVENVNFRATL